MEQTTTPDAEPVLAQTTSRPAINSPLVSMWALFLGVLLMMLGNGLQGTLVGVRSDIEGFNTLVIGIILAAYYAGFLVGSRFTMRALGKVGHVRVFAALASLASTSALLYALFVNPPAWLAMRFVTGFCMAGLYVVAESWLNDQATPETRGRTLSIYMIVTLGGITGGQFLLNVSDPAGFELFVVASVLVSLALVPMALSESSAPRLIRSERLPLSVLLKVVPTGVITMFFSGAAAGALFALGPVYASQIGMSTAQISLFVSAAVIGAALFQMPIGQISDRVSRRAVMAVVAALASAASLGGVMTGREAAAFVVLFIVGATSFPLYSLAVAYTNDWIEDDQRVGASGLLVMVNGVGAILGPLATSAAMSVFGPVAFWWALTFIHVAALAYLVYRILAKDPLSVDEQSTYQPLHNRSSPLASVIGRRIPVKPRSGTPRASETKAP